MQKNMLNKIFVIGIIFLFIGVGFQQGFAKDTNTTKYEYNKTKNSRFTLEKNDIYYPRGFLFRESRKDIKVDIEDEITCAKYLRNITKYSNYTEHYISKVPSVIYVPNDYPTIQSAVDNATVGDTIIVRDGKYIENVIVDKQLTIQSENGFGNCTIKTASGDLPVFKITSDLVTIRGFKVKGLVYSSEDKGIVISYSNSCTIIDNYIFETNYCIKLINSNNTSIYNNVIGKKWCIQMWGIWLVSSDNNKIFNNTIERQATFGFGILMEQSNNNLILNNNIQYNNYGIIGDESSENNTVRRNSFKDNHHGSVSFYFSNQNIIVNNTFSNTYWDGIYLHSSDQIIIKNNSFHNDGIFVFDSYHNTVKNNVVNEKQLVYLENEYDKTINEEAGQIILINCENILIQNQEISNIEVGIELWNTNNSALINNKIYSNRFDAIWLAYSNYTKIQNNDISTSWQGIGIYYSQGNNISGNNIYSNDWEGIYFLKSNFNLILRNNVSRNYDGITLEESTNNNIYYNEILFTESNFYGLILLYSNFNNIKYNTISNNYLGLWLFDSYHNSISYNVFLLNEMHASFILLSFQPFFSNKWYCNYWGRPRILPKLIIGSLFDIIPWFNIDWNPAKEPYDLGV